VPLYEYECDNGHRFEEIQKFSDPPIDTCPKCGAPAHKQLSSPAFQFKGTGWYVTDYAKKDAAAPAAGKSEGGGASEGKSETKSDSKTETKSETKGGPSEKKSDSPPAKSATKSS